MPIKSSSDAEDGILIKDYFNNFVRFYADSYAIQWHNQNRHWKTKHKNFSDILIRAHLNQVYSVAAAAAYYPIYYFLDFDFGPDENGGIKSDRIGEAIRRLNLTGGQFSLMTSPRFAETGNCHLALKLTESDSPVPIRKGLRLLRTLVGDLCEVYPQPNKKFRLPLGFGQHLIEDGLILSNLSWQSALHFLLKKEAVQVESLPKIIGSNKPNFRDGFNSNNVLVKITHPLDDDCRILLEEGLTAYGTRFESQWLLVCYYQRRGASREDNFEKLIRWLKNSHHGFSKTINRGDWKIVCGDIKRQIKSAYRDSKNRNNFQSLPNAEKTESGFTEYDLAWIADVFPKDIVRQKKLARLLLYCRSNRRHGFEWIYIPYHAWQKIAGARTYKKFIAELEDLGIIQSDLRYRHVKDRFDKSFPRRFKVDFPAKTGAFISDGGAAPIRNYLDALLVKFGSNVAKAADFGPSSVDPAFFIKCSNVAKAADFVGIARQRIYEHLKRGNLQKN
ncbi:MAG: hypothetical protein ACR2N3_10265 [Pyrinomonadaceae bacterium]